MLNEELKSAREALVSDWERALSEYKALADKPEYGEEPDFAIKVLIIVAAAEDGYVDRFTKAAEELDKALPHINFIDIECLVPLTRLFMKAHKKPPKFLQLSTKIDFYNYNRCHRVERMCNFLIDMALSSEAEGISPELRKAFYEAITEVDAYYLCPSQQVNESFFTDVLHNRLCKHGYDYEKEMLKIYDILGKPRKAAVIVDYGVLIVLGVVILLGIVTYIILEG